MLIKNVSLKDRVGKFDILIEAGLIKAIENNIEVSGDITVLDAMGGLALEPFVEPHIHLDTTMTAGKPKWNISGTLFEGIENWSEYKKELTVEDTKRRAKEAIKLQVENGIQYIRSHCDVTDPSLTALKALVELKEELKELVDIQIVAFPQEGILSYPQGKELLEKALELGADVIGGIPHFEYQRDWGVESIRYIIDLAVKHNKLIDVHCDEIDDENSKFLEVLASEAWLKGIGELVTASHTTAMGSYNDAYTSRLFRVLKESKINFVANPLVNIHLGGRFDTYPKRRGLTRVKELTEAGINVAFGHDDIYDQWYPLGTGNPLQVLHMGLHLTHMMGYDEISKSLDFITTNGAKTLNLKNYELKVGNPANLIIFEEEKAFDIVRNQQGIKYSIRHGRIIVEAKNRETFLQSTLLAK